MEKLSLVKCKTYDYILVRKALEENIKKIGGLGRYILPGEKVLLKVNLVMGKEPDKHATTHPIYIKALSHILVDYGCTVVIGDSPGGPFNKTLLKNHYKNSEYLDLTEENIALNYNCKEREIENPKGKFLTKVYVTDMVYDVDKIISMSKFKTHGMMTYTGAVKNMFGIVPGVRKAKLHLAMPSYNDFADSLIDICLAKPPVLSFMDAIVGMEGEGPTSGTPRKIGLSILGTNPFVMDKVCIQIANLKTDEVPTVNRSITRKLTTPDYSDVEIYGEDIYNYKLKDYKIPKTSMIGSFGNKTPDFIKKFVNNRIQPRPTFNYEKCVSCNICKNSCPPEVIEMINKKPVVDLNGCIRCFCCQELCPHSAVEVKRPKILRLFRK